jgi:peptidoglycan/LPS O-acetylase OafA/YrhL
LALAELRATLILKGEKVILAIAVLRSRRLSRIAQGLGISAVIVDSISLLRQLAFNGLAASQPNCTPVKAEKRTYNLNLIEIDTPKKPQQRKEGQKLDIPIIQALRGIASLAVCWFHLTYLNSNFPRGLISHSGRYGYLGVEVFFVISGFIVPYSLLTGGYELKSFWKFLAKRVMRVDPPYLASILLVMALALLAAHSAAFAGAKPHFSVKQIILHLGYLIPFFENENWINGVYWTLAVEFQYYVCLGLLFPALISKNPVVRRTAFLLALCAPWINGNIVLLPHFAPLFLIGIVGMELMCKMIGRPEFLIVVTASVIAAAIKVGIPETCAGVGAIVCILCLRSSPRWLLALGNISYSLYLVHEPIGDRVVNLGLRFWPSLTPTALPFLGCLASIIFATTFYLAIERPAKGLASKIRYRPT